MTYRHVITEAFPEIQFDSNWAKGNLLTLDELFLTFLCTGALKSKFWQKRENRRQALIDLATSKGLDPFDTVTWETKITHKDVMQAKVKQYTKIQFFTHHNGQAAGALNYFDYGPLVVDAFPELRFTPEFQRMLLQVTSFITNN
jgi:hypothetical protein